MWPDYKTDLFFLWIGPQEVITACFRETYFLSLWKENVCVCHTVTIALSATVAEELHR